MMGIEPITRKEMFMAAAAGESVATPTPVTREEYFLSKIVGSGGGGGGAITTLHINVTGINTETMKATITADKTPAEIKQAALDGPVWCVVSIPAGILAEEAISLGVPPTWYGLDLAFGCVQAPAHDSGGNNIIVYVVRPLDTDTWLLDLNAFGN